MRVVYLSPVGVVGGAEQCLLHVMTAMRRAEPRAVLTLIAGADGPLLEHARAADITVRLLPMPPQMAQLGESILHRGHNAAAMFKLASRALRVVPATQTYCRALGRLVRDAEPELIHSNGLKMHLLASLSNLPAHKTVWHLHDFLADRPAMDRALRWASRRAAGAIAISHAVARDAHSALPRLRVEVIYNAIDVEHFCPGPANQPADGARLDALAGLPSAEPGTLRVGLVATFARWKGQNLLLEAATHLFADRPQTPVRFYVIGGPIYQTQGSQFSEQELRARASALGIGHRVGFIGFQRDPRDVYRDLDIVVHASTQPEPFGLTIVEAMACGKPVIVSRAGGAAELFTPDHDAVGVKPGDAPALARAIAALLDHPDRRAALGRNARQSAQSRFSHERLGNQMLGAYRRFLHQSAPPAPDEGWNAKPI